MHFLQYNKKLCVFALFGITTQTVLATDCSNPTGCRAYTNSPDGSDINVVAGNYHNAVPTPAEYQDEMQSTISSIDEINDTTIVHPIFSATDSSAKLHFNDKTTITMDTSFLSNAAYSPYQNAFGLTGTQVRDGNVTIPKGVTFIIKGQPLDYDYSEIEGLDINRGTVDSQADFNILGPNALAYNVYNKGAKLTAHDSSITLGKDSQNSEVIFVAGDSEDPENSPTATLTNVTINGSGKNNIGYQVQDAGTLNVNAGSLNLTGDNSIGIVTSGGNLNINNSSVNSPTGIALFAEPEIVNPTTINLSNSTLKADDALLLNNNQALWTLDGSTESDLGNAEEAKAQAFTLNADNSILVGRVAAPEMQPASTVTFNLNNSSDWTLNGNSTLDELNVDHSSVHFAKAGHFKTLTINGNLTGHNATYYMNTDLADEASDKIIVKGKVQGNNKISVSDSRKSPKSANGTITLVTSNGGDGTFSMVQKYIDAGKYRYYFQKSGNDFILSNNGEASANPASGLKGPQISDFANSVISMRAASAHMLYQMQEPLDNKLFGLRNGDRGNNAWADLNYNYSDVDDSNVGYDLATSGYKQNTTTLQLGYDHSITFGNGQLAYLGALIGTSKSRVNFDKDYKDGDIHAFTTGIYGGWQNSHKWFADATYRYTHLKASANKMDDAKWHANSLTANVGKKIDLSGNWALTPKAGMTFGHLSGDDDTSSSNFYRTQVGATIKNTYSLSNAEVSPYFGAYWVNAENHLGDATLDDSSLPIKMAGNSGLVEAGVNVTLSKAQSINAKLNYQGGNHANALAANLLYRYAW